MKRRQQISRKPRTAKTTTRAKKARTGAKTARWKLRSGSAPQLHSMKISDFYRPLKRPVTLRLDADVLAWFKKDGRRYQTRINAALRKVMEKEMREKGW